MSIIIFLIILGLLIFVHELGHFLVAKWSKIRVDEFAIGFPPKIFSFTKGETRYALNLIPFGGYVKIFGENPDEDSLNPNAKNSFINKSRWIQAAVLVAGVSFNFIFAWMLISASYMLNTEVAVNQDNISNIQSIETMIVSVSPDSPAAQAGVEVGDKIISLRSGEDIILTANELNVENLQNFISNNSDSEIEFTVERFEEVKKFNITPVEGITPDKKAVGIMMSDIGEIRIGFFKSIWEGLNTTILITQKVAVGLYEFLTAAVIGKADFNQVSGPVGLVGHVGEAAKFGIVNLLTFTALISLNLAVINLIPFPALDGGRLLFVAIEGITRKNINVKFVNTLNLIGFALLMLLMISVTVSDIVKLF
jgi:regulator of sigma E protease